MQHVFWLEPGAIAGRSGPNLDPWDLSELRAGGIDAVLSVNDGDSCEPADFAAAGLAYACRPLTKAAPPEPDDDLQNIGRLEAACAWIDEQRAAGRTVLVHCRSGKDRTGLTMAYFLCTRRGFTAADAFDAVRAVRPIAFTAEGWELMTRDILQRVAASAETRQ